ncbi:CHAP domain-containing protein [Desulfosporosinus sp. SB140]|uniref:CHAP domain-containing protein n=1 Tax=Desulfosporosinus paludis TaxID=3115649 RepID=UPI00388F2256
MTEKAAKLALIGILLLSLGLGLHFFLRNPLEGRPLGKIIDNYKNVPVYYNGQDYTKDKEESFSSDGYYCGLKWQCVEYVKRFYYVAKHHRMPDGYGDAKDFFDPSVPQGGLNQQRGLKQYINGGNEKPELDDILVFTNPPYGHVAIVTKVTTNSIEVIQQNAKSSRQVFTLIVNKGHFFVGTSWKPVGWLRK